MTRAGIDERPKSPIEKRKRNLIFFSPISRRERETWNSFPQFREGKEKCEKGFSTFEKWTRKGFSFLKFREEKENFFKSLQLREEKEKSEILFPSFEKRKRNLEKGSPLSRREREMDIILSRFERRKRIPTRPFEKFSLSPIFCQSYCDSQSFRESESLLCEDCDFSSNAYHANYFYISEHTHVLRRPC